MTSNLFLHKKLWENERVPKYGHQFVVVLFIFSKKLKQILLWGFSGQLKKYKGSTPPIPMFLRKAKHATYSHRGEAL